MLKKVAIITYYWPPSGGAGVQRWLKFTKYLPENGWQPIVFIPENANYPSIDDSLEKDIPKEAIIYKIPIWEPYDLYRKFAGLPKNHKISHTFNDGKSVSSWKNKISLWLKSNLFIPDPRLFWFFSGRRRILEILKKHEIDIFITTSPPNSIQLFGLYLKKHLPEVKWIADFRDPWTEIFFNKTLPKTFISRLIDKRLEAKVLKSCDRILTVSENWVDYFNKLSNSKKTFYIPNGFDRIFENIEINYKKFTLVYTGTLFNIYDMPLLWIVLNDLLFENNSFKKDLQILIAGSVSEDIKFNIKKTELNHNIEFLGYINNNQLDELYKKATCLMITTPTENDHGIIPAKVFEYLSTGKPIISISNKNNGLSKIILTSKAGIVVSYDDYNHLKSVILDFYAKFNNKDITTNSFEHFKKYSRQNLTHQLSEYLNNL